MNEIGKRLSEGKLIAIGVWSKGRLNEYGIRYGKSSNGSPLVEFGSFLKDEYQTDFDIDMTTWQEYESDRNNE